MKRYQALIIAAVCITGLSVCPDAKAADIPQEVVEYAVDYCQTQTAYNISRHNHKSLHDCATVIAVNIPKLQSVGLQGYRQWVNNAQAQCHAEQDVYSEQYCLMVTTAISNYFTRY